MHTTLVTPAQLAQHLDDPRWVVLDIRHDLARPERWGEDEYRAGHIPGAVFLHLDRDLSAPKNGRNGRHPLPSAYHISWCTLAPFWNSAARMRPVSSAHVTGWPSALSDS